MKIGKKILCGAMASLALFTGMGVLSGCTEKDPKVNYQAKIETIINNWGDKLDCVDDFDNEGVLYNVVKDANGLSSQAFDMFADCGIALPDISEFTVFGGQYNGEGVDNKTIDYINIDDEYDYICYMYPQFKSLVGEIKIDQYYKVKGYDSYIKFMIDSEKVRFIQLDYEDGAPKMDCSITDIYYADNSAEKMIRMSLDYEKVLASSLEQGDYSYFYEEFAYEQVIPSSDAEKRALDGKMRIDYHNDPEHLWADVEIYSEVAGIYYQDDEFTSEIQRLMTEMKEEISKHQLTIGEISEMDTIEIRTR